MSDSYPMESAVSFLWNYVAPALFVFGIGGNILSALVLNKMSMRSTSVGLLLSCLAMSDTVILLVGGGRHIAVQTLHLGDVRLTNEIICKFQRFILYTALDFSAWIMTAVTTERYITVCKPLRVTSLCSLPKTKIAVGIIMLLVVLKNIHVLFTCGFTKDTKHSYQNHTFNGYGNDENVITYFLHNSTLLNHSAEKNVYAGNTTYTSTLPNMLLKDRAEHIPEHIQKITMVVQQRCGYVTPKSYTYFWKFVFPWIVTVIYALGPFLIMIIFNILIIRALSAARLFMRQSLPLIKEGGGDSANGNKPCTKSQAQTTWKSKDKTMRSLTIMLVTVSLFFIFTASPSFINLIAQRYWQRTTNHQKSIHKLIVAIVLILLYTNHSCNFLLYCISGQKFRSDLKKFICCKDKDRRKSSETVGLYSHTGGPQTL